MKKLLITLLVLSASVSAEEDTPAHPSVIADVAHVASMAYWCPNISDDFARKLVIRGAVLHGFEIFTDAFLKADLETTTILKKNPQILVKECHNLAKDLGIQ